MRGFYTRNPWRRHRSPAPTHAAARANGRLATRISPVGGLCCRLAISSRQCSGIDGAGSPRAAAAAIVACLQLCQRTRADRPGAPARHADHSTPPCRLQRAHRPLHVRAGSVYAADSSQNREAQAFFNQGFQLTYAFAKPEAVRSFREAEMRDPMMRDLLLGRGLGLGIGSELGQRDAIEAPFAHAAIQKAVALAPAHATPIERAFIQATSARYVERFDPAKRVEQDRAYADAMKKVVDAYPEDLDAAALPPRRCSSSSRGAGARDIANPNVQRIAVCWSAR